MTTYATGNPLGSTNPKDLKDNAENFDKFANGTATTYPDRFGVQRKSIQGMNAEFNTDQSQRVVEFNQFLDSSGYETPVDYAPGISITRTAQQVRYLSELYRPKDDTIPFVTTTFAADEAKWISNGDNSLRQELAGPGGAGMSGYRNRDVASRLSDSVSVADYPGADPAGSTLSNAAFTAAYAESKVIHVPDGLWRLTNPLDFPADAYFYGQGRLVFDKAEWVRRGDATNGFEYYTVFYGFTSQSQVHCSIDGVEVAIAGWQTPFTFYVTLPNFFTNLSYWVINGTHQLGASPQSLVTFNAFGALPPDLVTGHVGPEPWRFTGADNYADGAHTGQHLTSGSGNTLVGPRCGTSLTVGSNNNFSGFQTGHRTVSGNNNVANGSIALEHNISGSDNIASGVNALGSNKTGNGNCAGGTDSSWSFTGGNYNTSWGHRSLANGANNNPNASQNTAIGAFSQDFAGGTSNTSAGYRALNAEGGTGLSGSDNTVMGAFAARKLRGAASATTVFGSLALMEEESVGDLTAFGFMSLSANKGGTWNTGHGFKTLSVSVSGIGNTATGWSALSLNNGAGQNTANGARSQEVSTTGSNNTTSGFESGRFITTGSANTLSGTRSGRSITTGNDNVAMGSDSLQFETTGLANSALGRGSLRLMQDGSNQVGVSNSTGVGANSKVSGSNQVQLGDAATTPYAHAALQIRSDERDKIGFRPLSKPLELIRGIEWCEFQKNERGLYFDEVIGTRMVSESYESAFVDSEGRPILAVREVAEEYTYLVEVPNDGSRAGMRFHGGAKAQQIQALCESLGIDWAGLQHHAIKGGLDIFTVAYEALIPYLGHAIQHLLDKSDEFESRLSDLEAMIAA